jgi:hypothetical protein
MRSFVRKTEKVIDFANGIRERPAARNDEQRDTSACVGDPGQDGLEVFDPRQQSTADSHNNRNRHPVRVPE